MNQPQFDSKELIRLLEEVALKQKRDPDLLNERFKQNPQASSSSSRISPA